MSNKDGMIVAFSGVDGAGKTTQIEILMKRLRQHNRDTRIIWSRIGYTPLIHGFKDKLRMLLRGHVIPQPQNVAPQKKPAFQKKHVRYAWLILSILDLMWMYGVQIRWLRRKGCVVICDRFLWDSLIDLRVMFPHDNVEKWLLWSLLEKITPRPDAAFLFLIPAPEAERRSILKRDPVRSFSEITDRLTHYKALSENGYWDIMDGLCPVNELACQISQVLETYNRGITVIK